MALVWWPFLGFLLLVGVTSFSAIHRTIPVIKPDGSLPSWNETEASFRAREYWAIAMPLAGALLFGLTLWINPQLPHVSHEASIVGPQIATLYGGLLVVLTIVQWLAGRKEAAFGRHVPALAHAVTPAKIRIASWLSLAVPIGFLVSAMLTNDLIIMIACEAVALLLIALRPRLLTRYFVKARVPLREDDPLTLKMREACAAQGITPKNLIEIPSTVSNGYVLPGGTVGITSGLRWLLTDDEVVAVLVHEFCHYRRKDVHRFGALRLGTFLAIALAVAVTVFQLVPYWHVASVVSAVLSLIFVVSPLVAMATGPYIRGVEYICDAAAVNAGYGPALASGLDKLARYMGHPKKWPPYLSLILTHPSYEDRFARIQAGISGE